RIAGVHEQPLALASVTCDTRTVSTSRAEHDQPQEDIVLNKTHRLLSLTTAIVFASTGLASAEPSAELIEAAKAEGQLTVIALPHTWCAYGDVIANFKKKYPEIQINELNPNAGSADELEAVRANKDNKGPQA